MGRPRKHHEQWLKEAGKTLKTEGEAYFRIDLEDRFLIWFPDFTQLSDKFIIFGDWPGRL